MACRSPHRAFFAVVVSTALLGATPTPAHAEPADVASSLFQQARSKMEAGDFAAACPLLDESFRLDPKPGTLFTLANCRDREGKLAAASGRYGEYIRTVDAMGQAAERKRHAERREIADKRLRELEKEVPTLKLVWQGGFPSDVKVKIDDVELSTTTLGLALPFDPGEHVVQIRRPGYPEFSRRLELKKGTTVDVDLSTWESPKSGNGGASGTSGPADDSSGSSGSGRKKAGFVFLGLGGAGLAFGGIMGTLAVLEKQTVTEHCKGPQGLSCDKEGFVAVDKMRSYALPSTIGFIAGGVLAATGLVLVLTAPKTSPEKTATVTMKLNVVGLPGRTFVGLEGSF